MIRSIRRGLRRLACLFVGHDPTHPYGPDDYRDWAVWTVCRRCGMPHGRIPEDRVTKTVVLEGGEADGKAIETWKAGREIRIPVFLGRLPGVDEPLGFHRRHAFGQIAYVQSGRVDPEGREVWTVKA